MCATVSHPKAMMLTLYKNLATKLAPPLIAGLAVFLEPRMTEWAKGREAVLPLILFLLLSSLLHPRMRNLLVITLCYGVALLAFRDVFRARHIRLPERWDYDFLDQGRPIALLLVAILSTIAALGETWNPGTVWARRCYFGAAALYFTGMGVMNFVWHGNWQSLLLCLTGITAFFGCLFAHRIVASELAETQDTEPEDMEVLKAKEVAHRRALRAKEWHERGEETTGESSQDTSLPPSLPNIQK